VELLKKYPRTLWEKEYELFEGFRLVRLCAWLRTHRPPDDNVGYSILIWRLDDSMLQNALYGEPPELAEPIEGIGPTK